MTKQKIISRTKYWQEKLGLQNWRINVWFENFKASVDDDKYLAVGKTECNPTYLLADITYKKSYLYKVSDPEIIHELLHLFLSDVISYVWTNSKDIHEDDAWLKYFEEKTISILARTITRLYKV